MKCLSKLSLRLLTIIFLFSLAINLPAQTTWTGNIGTDWNTVGNWSAGVPDAADDVTIPDTANNPVIHTSGIVVKSVTIQAGGLLTINASGVLSVNGSVADGLLNMGTIENNGVINIDNTSAAGDDIQNDANFNNNSGASIHINRSLSGTTCLHVYQGTFTNAGTVTIAANGFASKGLYANQGGFINSDGGVLNISEAGTAVEIAGGVNNFGIINIQAVGTGLNLLLFAGFFNSAIGTVNIDGAGTGIVCNTSSLLNNLGTVTMGAKAPANYLFHPFEGTGLFRNAGVFKASGTVRALNFENYGGVVSPGHPVGKLVFDSDENFASSTINMDVKGVGVAGVDYDQVQVYGKATLGGYLALSINTAAADGDQVTLLTAGSISGKFGVTGLHTFWKLIYTPTSVILHYDLTNVWTGAAGPSWYNAGSWSHGVVPTPYTNVRIPTGTTVCTVMSDVVVNTIHVEHGGGLSVQSGATLTIAGKKNFNGVSAALYNKGNVGVGGQIVIVQ